MASPVQDTKKRNRLKKARKPKLIECSKTMKISPRGTGHNLPTSSAKSIQKTQKIGCSKKLKQISSISQGKPTPIPEKKPDFSREAFKVEETEA